MKVIYERCAGLDVHKKTVVACARIEDQQETRTFGTMTEDLLALSDWLMRQGVTHVAMESTGEFTPPPIGNIEGGIRGGRAQGDRTDPKNNADAQGIDFNPFDKGANEFAMGLKIGVLKPNLDSGGKGFETA